jgi:uncharacterized protein (DUF488 family)
MKMIDTVYTIGYSGFLINDFISTIKSNNISLIIDVRSQPYSQYFSDYNKEGLQRRLESQGIYYRNYVKEFGARQDERQYYSKNGYLDFELYAKSPSFLKGIEKLINSMNKGYKFALMCAEKDPSKCHRAILVAKAFHDAGYNIIHLLPNNEIMTQEDLEHQLVEKYFPNRDQITLFDEKLSEKDYVEQAYRKRNAEIGYSIGEENE